MNTPFPPGPFELVYADPCWAYSDSLNNGNRGAAHKYSVMDYRDIARLPVRRIAADNCLLAMWWVGPMPLEALYVMRAWGFELKTMKGFTWHKLTKNGKSHFGMGHWTRANTEDCLFAVRGKPKRINASVRQFIETERPPLHSQKPAEVRDRLVQLMGDVPRIELFARTPAPGWSAWGDELEAA